MTINEKSSVIADFATTELFLLNPIGLITVSL